MKDQAAFTLGVSIDQDAKALTEDGDLLIEGYASDYDTDRHQEAFEPGAFEEGLANFMQNPVLLYHHKADFQLGVVEEARVDAKGLWIKARLAKPEPQTTAADIFSKVKRGMMKGFSVAGDFYRKQTANGPKIYRADLHEISVTPLPVNPRTLGAVAAKAFPADASQDEKQKALDAVETLVGQLETLCQDCS